MANIVCITTGLTGILNASFEIARRLEDAGHTCHIASPSDVRNKAEINDCKFIKFNKVNFDPAPSLPNYQGALRKIKRMKHKILHASIRKKRALEALDMNSFKMHMKSINPDLILIDIELHEHIMTLTTNNYKVLLLSQWFSTWKRKGLPPITSETIPNLKFNGSAIGMAIQWKKIEMQRWWMFGKKKILSAGTDRRSILKLYAQKIGFNKKFIRENYWPGPLSYAHLPVVSITNEALEFPHDVRPKLDYVGAMVYEKRQEGTDELPALNKIFERKVKEKAFLIYCSVSTFKKGDTAFLQNVVKAVEGKNKWLVIISLGGQLNTNIFDTLPSNVFTFTGVPQLTVLQHADLSINHGGIHTINECIHFKVPILVYSGKRSDQNGCAARVHHHGVGLMADKDVDGASEISRNIDLVLKDEVIKKNVELAFLFNLKVKKEQKLESIIKGVLTNGNQQILTR